LGRNHLKVITKSLEKPKDIFINDVS